MAELTFNEAYRTHGFLLEIEGESCPVTKVTGLSEGTTDIIEQPDGGSPVVHRISSGVVKFENLVVERNVDGSPFDKFFQDWFREMFQLNGESRGSQVRRNGAVIVKGIGGQADLRFAFYEAWVQSSTFVDLEAGSGNLFKQTVNLVPDAVERIS